MAIHVASSIDEVRGHADDRMKNDWLLAADVYTNTQDPQRGRPYSSSSTNKVTILTFAKQGIRGLRSQNAVARWRRTWQYALDHGAKPLAAGDVFVEPDLDFDVAHDEAAAASDKSEAVRERHAKAIMSDPEKAQRVMSDPEVRKTVAKAVAKDPEAKREFYHAVEEGLGSPKGRPVNQPTQDIIPSAVLRGIANDAISLADRLANLIDLIEQHPEVIPAIKALTNMGGGTPDYLSFALGTLSPAVEDAQKAIGPYLPANMAKAVTA